MFHTITMDPINFYGLLLACALIGASFFSTIEGVSTITRNSQRRRLKAKLRKIARRKEKRSLLQRNRKVFSGE